MSIRLQERDLELLKLAFKFRVISYSQIHTKLFAGCNPRTSCRRIRELSKAGLLSQRFLRFEERAKKSVSLTNNGWHCIRTHWPFEIDRPHLKSESPEHDVRFADVVLKFEKLQLFDGFFTENLLQSSSTFLDDPSFRDLVNLQSDGAIRLKDPAGRPYLYAVEFEISKKSLERYEKKLSAYYQSGGIDGVIYICEGTEIPTLIARADKNVRPGTESIVFLGDETAVMKNSGKMFFRNIESKGLGLY